MEDLLEGELIDQIKFTRQPEYVFHHPLIRTVAYESQLKSDRAELHRRVAAAIESRDPAAAEENAALIAEHLEAAGDLHAAYGWHMRAATWATNRDINAARLSWERAQTIADAVPAEDENRIAMRIAPRTMLCGIAWRVHSISLATALRNYGSCAPPPGIRHRWPSRWPGWSWITRSRAAHMRRRSWHRRPGPHRVDRRCDPHGGAIVRAALRQGTKW